ncbi:hypothetical protein DAETH_35920 (plasmid) [Deinococcus aetherius]|uniref:Uncharacterized protein n=1 Tax=Deinococcus aetherius TaxID=200252 RepID=A0ABN6RLK3_9DEIO|nr:hypothetical protein DAETH_35920 [Deinococcus aetherius]
MVAALRGLDADVVRLMEVQDNSDIARQDLVGGVNAAVGVGTHAGVAQLSDSSERLPEVSSREVTGERAEGTDFFHPLACRGIGASCGAGRPEVPAPTPTADRPPYFAASAFATSMMLTLPSGSTV